MIKDDPNIEILYPITVKDMVKALKTLTDTFYYYTYYVVDKFYQLECKNKIRYLKKSEPKLFRLALPYLGEKRIRVLKEIFGQPKLNNL